MRKKIALVFIFLFLFANNAYASCENDFAQKCLTEENGRPNSSRSGVSANEFCAANAIYECSREFTPTTREGKLWTFIFMANNCYGKERSFKLTGELYGLSEDEIIKLLASGAEQGWQPPNLECNKAELAILSRDIRLSR